MSKIQGRLVIQNHADAVGFFNSLLIDLKKKEAGLEHDAITMERLKEGSKHVQDIANCTRSARIYDFQRQFMADRLLQRCYEGHRTPAPEETEE